MFPLFWIYDLKMLKYIIKCKKKKLIHYKATVHQIKMNISDLIQTVNVTFEGLYTPDV